MVSRLGVWMYGRKVGVLSRQRARLSFAYSSEALEEFGLGVPLLSVSMPTRSRRYDGAVPYAFFNGLLPEGEARQMIAYDFEVDDLDVLGLLGAIGRDCAGALVVIPDGDVPDEDGRPEPISDSDVVARISRLGIAPLGVDGQVRASLAGMQRKLLLSRLGNGWGLPVNGAPSTHILKPPHHDVRFPHMIANEALCLRIARHLGLSVADVEVAAFDGLQVLVVERYDRAPQDQERVSRLHQEDFCQAHAIDGWNMRKYEEGGGPSLRQCAQTLRDWARDPDRELERLLDISTLNVLVGNGDAHGKNLSLLHDRAGQVRLAPAYDVFSTFWYPAANTVPGMFVNGVRDLAAITRDDLVQEAVSWGVPAQTAAAQIDQVLGQAEAAITSAGEEIECPEDLLDAQLARARALAA